MKDSRPRFIILDPDTSHGDAISMLCRRPDARVAVFDDEEPHTHDFIAPEPLKLYPVLVDNKYLERGESARAIRRREAREAKKKKH